MKEFCGYKVREGTLDEYIVRELSGYKKLALRKTDKVLDIGACIGSYAKWAAEQCKQVLAVEPVTDNVRMLQMNVEDCKNVRVYHAAVVSKACIDDTITMYLSSGPNKGSHTVVPTRGRVPTQVNVIHLDTLMSSRPTVLKIDCEGAEYGLLGDYTLPLSLRAVIIEMHLQKREHKVAAPKLDKWLKVQGFIATKAPKFGASLWHTTAIYERV